MNRIMILIAIASIFASFAIGRYSVSPEVKTITQVKTQTQVKFKTQIIRIKSKDGSEKTIETITQDTSTSVSKINKKEVKANKKPLNISLMRSIHAEPIHGPDYAIYGLSVTKEIVGPFTVGAWTITNGYDIVIGASIGVNF